MLARIAMLKAMNHGHERVFRTDRKETHWGKRKAEAGSMSATRVKTH
jgi:hypothetical protein